MRDLSVGKESKIIFQFALPMLIGNVFQQIYTLINSIIVGNFVGKEALAAVGASFPLIFTLISLVIGIAIGATIVIRVHVSPVFQQKSYCLKISMYRRKMK